MEGDGFVVGDLCYDEQTKLLFEVIDEGNKGRGVKYLGKCKDPSDVEQYEAVTLNAGQRLCYFAGDVILYEDATERDEEDGIIKDKTMYTKAFEPKSWLRYYLVEYERGVIIVPDARSPSDIDNIAFLVNAGNKAQANCDIATSKSSYSAWYRVLPGKTVKPGDILTGYYSKDAMKAILRQPSFHRET
jgi:hypothetical protein